MLTIYALKNELNNPLTFNLLLKDNVLSISGEYQETTDTYSSPNSPDRVENNSNVNLIKFDCGNTLVNLESYRSYGLMFGNFTRRTEENTVAQGNIKLVDYCRLGIASRETFLNIPDYWIHRPIGQFDTGLLDGVNSKMAFTIFGKLNDACVIDSDVPLELDTELPHNTFEPHGSMPRFRLWDRYAIIIDRTELKAIQNGRYINRGPDEYQVNIPAKDILEIDIQKYTADFSEKLNRQIDSHEIVIESTCGVLRSTRIDLVHGNGKAYLHTFGHLGRFKLKIGLRWYPVWCEYNLNLV